MDLQQRPPEYGAWRHHADAETCIGCLVPLLAAAKNGGITHDQRFSSRRHAKDETIEWMLWYNQSRLHLTLDYVSPMQFEKQWRADHLMAANA